MSVIDKMMFWKKDSIVPSPDRSYNPYNTGLNPPNLGLNTYNNPGFNKDNFGKDLTGLNLESQAPSDFNQNFANFPKMEPVTENSQPLTAFGKLNSVTQQPSSDLSILSKNIEVISSRIESIKMMLDTITHKIEKIEKIAEVDEQEKPPQNYNYNNKW